MMNNMAGKATDDRTLDAALGLRRSTRAKNGRKCDREQQRLHQTAPDCVAMKRLAR
jgi:hypothetical protein